MYGKNKGSMAVPLSSLLKVFDIKALERCAQDMKFTV